MPARMPIRALQAAKYLCREGGWQLSNLEIQKILYLCSMLYMGHMKRPLLTGHFEAWDYGPVHPPLYHNLKRYGADSVPEFAFDGISNLKEEAYEEEASLINQMANAFPHPSGPKLVALTHREESAWARKYVPGEKGIVISNDDMLEEYNRRYNKTAKVEA